jgi:hypothetical protein
MYRFRSQRDPRLRVLARTIGLIIDVAAAAGTASLRGRIPGRRPRGEVQEGAEERAKHVR